MTPKELTEAAQALSTRAQQVCAVLDCVALDAEIAQLEEQSVADGFWDDARAAGAVMQKLEALKKKRHTLEQLARRTRDLSELAATATEDDVALYEEEYVQLARDLEELERQMLLSGPYDAGNAIVAIYAGAGGTDAQDWAEMLLRMYTRWAQERGFTVQILDASRGAEAGYKSVTFEVRGAHAYGLLRTEMGTHRLVRLSPFNADSLRQTSFARVEVLPVLEEADAVVLDMNDVRVDTYRSQGAGGQSVNTTDSAVRVTHIPTGLVATCQNERSQLQNKEHALKVLRAKLLQKQLEEQEKERAALRGENTSAAWGSQIRSYVLHPYKMVKDHRTGHETPQVQDVLDGDIDAFIDAALRWHSQRDHGILETSA